jgi:hypothetical protein
METEGEDRILSRVREIGCSAAAGQCAGQDETRMQKREMSAAIELDELSRHCVLLWTAREAVRKQMSVVVKEKQLSEPWKTDGLFFYTVSDALYNPFHHCVMISMRLVVSKPHQTPT